MSRRIAASSLTPLTSTMRSSRNTTSMRSSKGRSNPTAHCGYSVPLMGTTTESSFLTMVRS
ncbi:MAG: hypothetical protein M5U09_02105 [Gammaproteobacteria bacterium]|nr:hypothetical protein [Gammaproteobacteria bacterium]